MGVGTNKGSGVGGVAVAVPRPTDVPTRFAMVPEERFERQFAVRPRGSDHLFPVRFVEADAWGEPPRLLACPTMWTVKDGKAVFWPEPSEDFEVFELVPVDARPAG